MIQRLVLIITLLLYIPFPSYDGNIHGLDQQSQHELQSEKIIHFSDQSLNYIPFQTNIQNKTNREIVIESNLENFIAINQLNLTGSNPDSFISIWDTSELSSGSSEENQIRLPLEEAGIYNFVIEWGDDTIDTITLWNQNEVLHNYNDTGLYTINITGQIEGWRFDFNGDRNKIIDVLQWGNLRLGNSDSYFEGAENLQISATDNLNMNGTTNFMQAFRLCTNLVESISLSNLDTSKVENMEGTFNDAYHFNGNISSWNVSNVESMIAMFQTTYDFNQNLEHWDVSNVRDMSEMFSITGSFNQPLNSWNVSNVENMQRMFESAESFNQPLNTWDVHNVQNMNIMFQNAIRFKQDISSWDITNVYSMSGMFDGVRLPSSIYDNILIEWHELNVRSNVQFSAGTSTYTKNAQEARQTLIYTYNWEINDGGSEDSTSLIIEDENTIPTTETTISELKIGQNYQIWIAYFALLMTAIIRIILSKYRRNSLSERK